MKLNMLKSKIHRATVVQSELDYVGSITIDETLMEAAGIYEYEKVQIADIDNGNRFETYVIAGEKDSGMICLNAVSYTHLVIFFQTAERKCFKLLNKNPTNCRMKTLQTAE